MADQENERAEPRRFDDLRDENEQLRTALESALDENTHLTNERGRTERRLKVAVEELRVARAAIRETEAHDHAAKLDRQSETEEELRVAFEELQVLTEELEIANTSLQQSNEQLDARVEERSRQIGEISVALLSAETSLRTVADLVPDLLWRTDPQGGAVWFNRRWFEYTADRPQEPLGHGWIEAVHPADRAMARSAWGAAVAGNAAYQRELRIRDGKGNFRWFLVRAEPIRGADEQVTSWYAAGTDIHDQRRAMEALQASELRFRTLAEGIPQLVWRSIDGGRWTWSSPQWSTYTGLSDEQSRVLGWLRAVHPDDRDAAQAAWAQAPATGQLEMEGRIWHAAEERYRHFRTRALPVTDEAGRTIEWLGTCTDVDDMLQLQQQQEVLVAELQHRTRNLMAVVRSITTRTIAESDDLEIFADCIDHRFKALARVQGLLSRRENGARVTLDELLRDELMAHVDLDNEGVGKQVKITGPSGVPLRSVLVQTLALALHELASNAVRHGALAHRGGQLDISWQVQPAEDGEEQRLLIEWRERCGAARSGQWVPKVDGYGRELIERALPYQLGARTTYQLDEAGLVCTIEVSVPAEQTESDNG